MNSLLMVIHLVTCVLLILVVLIQSGKGAEISASFSGSSQTVFGSSGGANFFTKFTQGAAAVFFITSLALTIVGARSKKSVFEGMAGMPEATAPAAQGAAPVTNGAVTPPVGTQNPAGAAQQAISPGAADQQKAPVAAAPQTK